MSKLDDQLKELQRRKAKIELYNAAFKSMKFHSDKFKDIAQEVRLEIDGFIADKIFKIEDGEVEQPTEAFTDQEVKILKKMANMAAERAKEPTARPQEPKVKKPVAETQDVLSFALKYRSWGGKNVNVAKAGKGKVVGMEAPHILVKLETNGMTVKVPPEDITL
jgi:hypothetical protein